MEQNQNSVGPLIGAIIIVVVLVAGGIYFLGTTPANSPSGEQATTTAETGIPNDDIASIEADLGTANLSAADDVDTALGEINTAIGK